VPSVVKVLPHAYFSAHSGPRPRNCEFPGYARRRRPIRYVYNLRYPGQYYDSETGLNYNYYRDYDPATGRYVESDPIGLSGGINTYAYGASTPVIYIDPLGLCWIYSQSTGHLIRIDLNGNITDLGYGYAGYGAGLNNPLMQNVSGQQPNPSGPLPQGNYSIGRQQYNRTQAGVGLPMSMRLTPNAGNDMLKRAGFLIHGPDNDDQHDSSEGCPIFNRPSRDIIAKSNDKCFQVVP
jgi:RHS repeat-associated protein